MTNPDNDADRSESSDSTPGGSEPSSAGFEAPPIEQGDTTDPTGLQPQYPPPPAYNPPPSPGYGETPGYPPTTGYPPPGGFAAPDYPPPAYPPPYPAAGSPPYPTPGYGAPGYGGPGYGAPEYGASEYGAPSYPPPPYGAGGYPPAGGWIGAEYGYGAPAPQGTNSLAIGSLVASGIGLFCCVGSIIGIVLGVVAMNQINQTQQEGRGLAIAGVAVGVLTLLISGIATIAIMSS
ncbi:DUF4190 domain-containing protein [Mycolicibacterium vaccae]|jgi:hypothetical protein|uniref:DUF4190 domain-containing protein n=1 Tax=Mycolicibacterium vaccae ATCC 25954 TaxID=1194972 RepID=K0UZZ0_MYCVA|nr:DUF4190 domain-containing protein [Mycolicibacterium vaccae]EJZ08188.1 hypothetical protein MVAC_16330 [Mycolicibacterium vaccae ATCC 25954]